MLGRLLFFAVSLAVGALVWDWSDVMDGSPSGDTACADRSTAWAMARSMVRANLGSATASNFPNRGASSGLEGLSFQYLGDCRHRISAFVDTYERSAGSARRYFAVELSYHGRSGWRLDRLDFIAPPKPETGFLVPAPPPAAGMDRARRQLGLWMPGGTVGKPEKPKGKNGLWPRYWRRVGNFSQT